MTGFDDVQPGPEPKFAAALLTAAAVSLIVFAMPLAGDQWEIQCCLNCGSFLLVALAGVLAGVVVCSGGAVASAGYGFLTGFFGSLIGAGTGALIQFINPKDPASFRQAMREAMAESGGPSMSEEEIELAIEMMTVVVRAMPFALAVLGAVVAGLVGMLVTNIISRRNRRLIDDEDYDRDYDQDDDSNPYADPPT